MLLAKQYHYRLLKNQHTSGDDLLSRLRDCCSFCCSSEYTLIKAFFDRTFSGSITKLNEPTSSLNFIANLICGPDAVS